MLLLAFRILAVSITAYFLSISVYGQVRASMTGAYVAAAKGSVSGAISAPGLANASGVKITLLGPDNSAHASSQMTGTDGSFVFYDLLPGTYSVEIDPETVPQKYGVAPSGMIEVKAGSRAETKLALEPHRSLIGHTYIDANGDGVYSPGKDTVVPGAQVSIGGKFVVSGSDGIFRIDSLAAGRTSLIASWPGSDHTTQVVLDLSQGPVTDRVVNVPLYR